MSTLTITQLYQIYLGKALPNEVETEIRNFVVSELKMDSQKFLLLPRF